MASLPEAHFVYKAVHPTSTEELSGDKDNFDKEEYPPLGAIDLGTYERSDVSNLSTKGKPYFDMGLRHMLSYQHEVAAKLFLACLQHDPYCLLAHALIALCHSPNYNFKGQAYYDSTFYGEELVVMDDINNVYMFPSQELADHHSNIAITKMEHIRKLHRSGGGGGKKKKKKKAQPPPKDAPQLISPVENQILTAVRTLTSAPGIDSSLSDETVGRPYSQSMRQVYSQFPKDPEVAYFFAESVMVLHAWELYDSNGNPLSDDVDECRTVLEKALQQHPHHAGLCHMYVHLSEMSSNPSQALVACPPLRTSFPHAGHLIHMATHIDVLVGDYEACVTWNYAAIRADQVHLKEYPATAGTTSFYYGYIVHNYHMLVYGCILGGFFNKGMECAQELNETLNQSLFDEYPDLAAYLESYSALDLHLLVRFGKWNEILQVEPPRNTDSMLYRAATCAFSKALAHAQLGNMDEAKVEAAKFNKLRKSPLTEERILHNNQISHLLAVDAPMLEGEIAYRKGEYDRAFTLLTKAVKLQDELRFDEPWGKMQPIRHALGGLLLEQGHIDRAIKVFETDLKVHPDNPWALVGLIDCLKQQCAQSNEDQIAKLTKALTQQRQSQWADFNIEVSCACCQGKADSRNGCN